MSDIFRAELDTRHFSFEAYGTTEENARQLMVITLVRHAVQTGISAADLIEAMRGSINVYRVAVGQGYRDREPLVDSG